MILQLARDNGLILDAGSAAITADGAGSVAYIDLGANYARYPLVVAQLNITAIDSTTGDEDCIFKLQFSDTTNFAIVRNESQFFLDGTDAPTPGAYFIAAIPRARYCRLFLDVTGTTPSITFGGKAYLNTFPGS